VPNRPPKLSGGQMRRLYALIVETAAQFEFARWTRERSAR
jgi:hypothetical protein